MLNRDLHRISSTLHLFARTFGAYKLQMIILTILGFFSGILEGIGINAIIPVFSFVTGETDTSTDFISHAIESLFAFLHIDFNLPLLLVFIALLFVLKAIALFTANYLNAKITFTYEQEMREQLFDQTLHTRWEYLIGQKIGYLEKVLMEHIGNAATAFMHVSSTILLVTSLLMYIAVALNISVVITLITLAVGGVIFLIFKPFMFRTRRQAQKLTNISKEVAHHINENMIGAKTVKSAAVEDAVATRGAEFFRRLRDIRIRMSLYENTSNVFIQPIGMIFILAVFAFSYQAPGFSFASFAVILYLIQKIFAYVQNTQRKLHSINQVLPFIRSVSNFLTETDRNIETDDGEDTFAFEKELVFKNVAFKYGTKKEEVLKKINLTIKKGEMIGLVGPSGAGKTTFVDLVLRLLEPTGGSISIDGCNVGEIDITKWRSYVAYVSQDIFLLNDTIENNIRFYDESLKKTDIIEAAKMAQIYDFVMGQPKKFQTLVGERGALLSGGQKQRIILARALAHKPELLILDEATSALDNESEVLVQKAIEELKGSITVIAIAHRLSTVMNSDRVIALENGKIQEEGTPKKLMKNEDSYFYSTFHIRDGE